MPTAAPHWMWSLPRRVLRRTSYYGWVPTLRSRTTTTCNWALPWLTDWASRVGASTMSCVLSRRSTKRLTVRRSGRSVCRRTMVVRLLLLFTKWRRMPGSICRLLVGRFPQYPQILTAPQKTLMVPIRTVLKSIILLIIKVLYFQEALSLLLNRNCKTAVRE